MSPIVTGITIASLLSHVGSGLITTEGEDMTRNSNGASNHRSTELLRWHKRHLGLYARVADKLGVSPSYVSLVASGRRDSDKVTAALSHELERTLKGAPRDS